MNNGVRFFSFCIFTYDACKLAGNFPGIKSANNPEGGTDICKILSQVQINKAWALAKSDKENEKKVAERQVGLRNETFALNQFGWIK